MQKRIMLVMALGLIGCVGNASAAGFEVHDHSASAMGMANAFTAQADDPSAMAYNPAGIAWQPGTGVMLGSVASLRNASARVAEGVASNNGEDPTVLHFYATWMSLDGHWGAGFGVNDPFLLDNQWGSNVFGGQATRTRLESIRTSMDVIYAFDSRLALAVGGDWYFATGEVNSASARFNGNDKLAIGGHASMMWKFYPGWSFGVIYRYSPTITLSGINVAAVTSEGTVGFNLPDSVQAGLAWDFTDSLKFELDGSWTGWSQLSDLNLISTTNQFNPLNLSNSFGIMAGVRWTWRENSQFRFGYAFNRAASRNTGFNARIADANQHRIALGFGGDAFGTHIDAAYIFSFLPSRTISGSGAFNGDYREMRSTLAVSVSTFF